MSLALDIFSIRRDLRRRLLLFRRHVSGLLRFPDPLAGCTRLTKADNLGLGLIVLGLLPQADGLLGALKLVAVWVLVQLAGATVAQLIARALRRKGPDRHERPPGLRHRPRLLVLAVAGWTIAAREAFASVVGYVAYGLLLSLVWVRLFAVDVALTEAAIGSGVTGVLLISAAVAAARTEAPAAAERPGIVLRVLAGALCAVVAAALAAVVLLMPDPGATLAPEAAEHLDELGVGNPITAVLIAYRSFDTMLEKVVLILAVIGVWSLAPDRTWGGAAGPRRAQRPEGALAFLAQMLPPLGIRRRHPHRLGRRQRAGRRLPGRRDPRRHGVDRHDGATGRSAPRSARAGCGWR